MRVLFPLLALFISGAASLTLETLWFEWLALHWGRTAEATAAVLASFMLGLGLGQWLMLRRQSLPLSAAKLWALCECLVGLLALAANARFANSSDVANWTAVLWMLAPTLFMGMTLPLAVACLRQQSFTSQLGLAYAANTSGAALGTVATAWWLIPQLGLSHTGLVAVVGQMIAAVLLWLAVPTNSISASSKQPRQQLPLKALLAVAASGLFVLGMEVIWFRALLLSHRSTTENFAVMLAVVLLGLALGSAAASAYLRHKPKLPYQTVLVLLLIAQSLLTVVGLVLWQPGAYGSVVQHSVLLILGPCICSGALMVAAANAFNQDSNNRSAAAGLVLASTLGSSIGAPLVALWLLPSLGVPASLQLLLLLTAMAALVNRPKMAIAGFAAIGIIATALPTQWQQKQSRAAQLYVQLDQAEIIAQADGKYQSVQLLETRFLQQPLSHRLLTDSYSMTSTAADSERYMQLFAWLPQAMRGNLSDALLISYGVGTTAAAILANPNTNSLTVADPSATILQTSRLIPREKQPLDDPRMTVRLEDGRKVLAQSKQAFDLITGEPPPPRLAGMHALYSEEYFGLMHQALKPQGWASYWLPVDQLSVASSKAIIAAFCSAFADCSLWAGSHYNWILLGSKHGQPQTQALSALFKATPSLAMSGLEHPAQLASTFIAGTHTLRQWVGEQAALNDNWPERIQSHWPSNADIETYAAWQDGAELRFAHSLYFQRWQLDAEILELAWALQPLMNGQFRPNAEQRLNVVKQLLQLSNWQAPLLWALGTDHKRVTIAQQSQGKTAQLHQAVALLAKGNHAEAAKQLQELGSDFPLAEDLARLAKKP